MAYSWSTFFSELFIINVCVFNSVYVCACIGVFLHGECVEVREQNWGVSSLFLPCRFSESNSGGQPSSAKASLH